MPTLRECVEEGRARKARLDEAVERGWRDCIPSERQNVEEWNHVMERLLEGGMDRVLELAGDVHLGPLPAGVGLHFSTDGDWKDEIPGAPAGTPAPGAR